MKSYNYFSKVGRLEHVQAFGVAINIIAGIVTAWWKVPQKYWGIALAQEAVPRADGIKTRVTERGTIEFRLDVEVEQEAFREVLKEAFNKNRPGGVAALSFLSAHREKVFNEHAARVAAARDNFQNAVRAQYYASRIA